MRESTMSNLSDIGMGDHLKTSSSPNDPNYFSEMFGYETMISKCSSMNDFRSSISDLEMLKNLSACNTQDINYLTMDSFKESFMSSEDDISLIRNLENEDSLSIENTIDNIDRTEDNNNYIFN